jgi:hypothetical protein
MRHLLCSDFHPSNHSALPGPNKPRHTAKPSKIRDVNITTPDVEGGSQVFEVGAVGKLRYFSQIIFAHDAFVRLIAIPDSVFKLAIILRQSLEDDVRASRGALVKRRSEKNNFSDLKFVCHDTLPLNKPSTVIVHQSGQRDKGLIGVLKGNAEKAERLRSREILSGLPKGSPQRQRRVLQSENGAMKPCAGNAWPLVFLNLQSIENLGMVMAGIDREGKPGIASEAATAIWSAKKPID